MFLRHYESIVIVAPDAGDEGLEKVLGRLREALERTDAREVRLEDWGTRRLAYLLGKHRNAHYLYYNFLGTNTTVAELERLLGITEIVLKYQTILLDGRVKVADFDFEEHGKTLTHFARPSSLSRVSAPPAPPEPEVVEEAAPEAEEAPAAEADKSAETTSEKSAPEASEEATEATDSDKETGT